MAQFLQACIPCVDNKCIIAVEALVLTRLLWVGPPGIRLAIPVGVRWGGGWPPPPYPLWFGDQHGLQLQCIGYNMVVLGSYNN